MKKVLLIYWIYGIWYDLWMIINHVLQLSGFNLGIIQDYSLLEKTRCIFYDITQRIKVRWILNNAENFFCNIHRLYSEDYVLKIFRNKSPSVFVRKSITIDAIFRTTRFLSPECKHLLLNKWKFSYKGNIRKKTPMQSKTTCNRRIQEELEKNHL